MNHCPGIVLLFNHFSDLMQTFFIHFEHSFRLKKSEDAAEKKCQIEFCIGWHGLYYSCSGECVLCAMERSAHNDQYTKVYSTERDEVH